ncbi:innexin shaking-B [Nephila pilipes]|uniref:Innexin n=1 Tax=Nephila pilipes TaxID=299642 RepID=A0A8X6P4L6_NEPPI|nr:innexin shaking-B [Nephila pilipes]
MNHIVRSTGTIIHVDDTKIDYEIFRLHYTFTVGFLLTFFVVFITVQIFNDSIVCEVSGIRKITSINSYCWIHSTYVVPKAFYKEVSNEVPHPGIDNTQNPEEFFYLTYYQWIYFMLFFQAVFFYLPRWIWKYWEGGKIKKLTKDIRNLLLPEKELNEKCLALIRYLVKSWSTHNAYARQYFICELLSLINVVLQFLLLDLFFDGRFINFGSKIFQFYTSEEYINPVNGTHNIKGNPMLMLFPRVTKCIFREHGKGSTIEVKDVLCVMTLNVFNEKIYLFLWFWFFVLAILTFLSLVLDILLIVSPAMRVQALKSRFYLVDQRDFIQLIKKGSFGDWLVIDLIGRNIDHVMYKDLVTEVAKILTDRYKNL